MKKISIATFFIFPSFALSLILNDEYIVNNKNIYAKDIYKEIPKKNNFLIGNFENNSTKFYISTMDLIEQFNKNNVSVETTNIRKIKFTYVPAKICINCIADSLQKEFQAKYPDMEIKDISVTPKNDINYLPERYQIVINDSELQKSNGLFYIDDSDGNRIHFKFNIEAYIEIVKSSTNIQKGEALTSSNTIVQKMKFERFRGDYLSVQDLNDVVAKGYIPKDRELFNRNIEKNSVVLKGQMLKGFIRDGNVYMETEVKALQNGGFNDSIQVETTDGIRLKAIIISSGLVKIL